MSEKGPRDLSELPLSQPRYLGKDTARIEDATLLTGRAEFGDNVAFPGMIDLMLTGRTYGAEEGQALGLSHYLVGEGEGLAKGIEIAKRVATNSPTTNFAIMHALPRIAEQDRASGYLMESLTAAIAQGNEEAKKRIKDFLEKRAAKVERK